jgi:hypothetical protein
MLILRSHPTFSEIYLNNNCKRKADNPFNCRCCKVHVFEAIPGKASRDVEGDSLVKLEEYCNWSLKQVESDRWRKALQVANQVVMD